MSLEGKQVMLQVTQDQTRILLKNSADPTLSTLSNDTALVVSLTAVFNASLDIADSFPKTMRELAGALASKSLAMSGVAATASGSRGLELANFGVGQTLKSIGLLKEKMAIATLAVSTGASVRLRRLEGHRLHRRRGCRRGRRLQCVRTMLGPGQIVFDQFK
jgi:hypothetical protein